MGYKFVPLVGQTLLESYNVKVVSHGYFLDSCCLYSSNSEYSLM